MDWFDLLAVQGALKSLLQHQYSKSSILWRSAFFMVQRSLLYMTTEKTIALTVWTFVDKVMLLLFNMLSRFVIAFLLKKSVQFSSDTQSCPSLCHPRDCSMPGSPVHYQLPELTQTRVYRGVILSNHFILCCRLLLLPEKSALHIRWPRYWSFSFSISPSNEYSGLISFRMDWLHLLAVQGTLKSLLQHHSSKASILPHSAFFIVQLSHPYMTTGKTIALTRRTFVGKVSIF